MSDSQRGIYRKYDVKRADGSSEPGRKHAECTYFVLDLEHDMYAIPALKAYAAACRATYPALARDIDSLVAEATRTLIARSSIGAGLANIHENGIEAELASLERETKPRRRRKR